MKNGFTLVEILIAVLIMGVLVTMAIPQYERAMEKSRLSEVRTMLKRLYEAKIRVLDNVEQTTYNVTAPVFGFENLDYVMSCQSTTQLNNHQVTCTMDDFVYVLNPTGTGNENYVCAVRRKGDYKTVNFLYKGDGVVAGDSNFFCNEGKISAGCELYGLGTSGSSAYCKLP